MKAAIVLSAALYVAGASAYAASVRSVNKSVEDGRNLASMICVQCHVVVANQAAPPMFDPPGPAFQAIADNPKTTAGSIRETLRATNHKSVAEAGMVNFHLSENDIGELSDYILSLRHTP